MNEKVWNVVCKCPNNCLWVRHSPKIQCMYGEQVRIVSLFSNHMSNNILIVLSVAKHQLKNSLFQTNEKTTGSVYSWEDEEEEK